MEMVWGSFPTDYVTKAWGMCDKCQLKCSYKGDKVFLYRKVCSADYVIKHYYYLGRTNDAIELLRGLPSELLKDYLNEERRTPTELVAVILDELQKRNEAENSMRL